MALKSATIDGVPVAGSRYVVYSPTRGRLSSHFALPTAAWSLAQDARKMARSGTPSDAAIYRWQDGWVPVQAPSRYSLTPPPGS